MTSEEEIFVPRVDDNGSSGASGQRPKEDNRQYKLSIKSLDAWFGTKQALKNVSIKIKENTVSAIIGPSG